jgi:type I restriction enzyme M protein
MLNQIIKSEIDKLWNKFWSGGISNPLMAVEQISYLLFMRRLDEADIKRIETAEWTGEKYNSLFKGELLLQDRKEPVKKETLCWSYIKQIPDEEKKLSHIHNNVFPYLKELNGSESLFTHHMKNAVFMIPKASLLTEAINTIERIYNEIENEVQKGEHFHDTQGDMYEYLLNEIAQAGKNGQFRTPRHIIQMIVKLLNPQLHDLICDPACGTGGFLLAAYQQILTNYTSKKYIKENIHGIETGTRGDLITDLNIWERLRSTTFSGFDFDSTMVRIGLMNLMLHGISNPQIDRKDTLSKDFHQDSKYTIILANPPFKGSIDKSDINENLNLKTTKTELLFVNKIYNMLQLGGKAGVIVPAGVLSTSSNAFIDLRKILVEQCELQAVISLPSGVFKPYAGVATAVLIFVKGGSTKKTWFYTMENDGYSLDDKRTKITGSDIPDILEKFPKQEISDKSFIVEKKDIVENAYSLLPTAYKPIDYKPVSFPYTPQEYVKKLIEIETTIMKELKSLQNLLGGKDE